MVVKVRFLLSVLLACQVSLASFAGKHEVNSHKDPDAATHDIPEHRKGFMPVTEDGFRVVTATPSDPEAPVDERPGYVRRWNSDRKMYYYVKEEGAPGRKGPFAQLSHWIRNWWSSPMVH